MKRILISALLLLSAVALSVLAGVPILQREAHAVPVEQYASSATASSSYGANPGDDWNASQATGAPDTVDGGGNLQCGDKKTAWAPLTSSSDPEWLEVSFATPVNATGFTVYETFVGGFVYQVDLIDTDNVYHTIWTGTDTTACPGEFTTTFSQTS